MIERCLQLFRLALCLLSVYGYMRLCMRRLLLEPEFALPVSLSGIGLLMLLCSLLRLTLPAAWALLAAGFALTVYSLYRRESLRTLLRPGLLFVAVCSVYFMFLLYGVKLFHIDNYSHWGTIVKTILRLDALPEHDPLVYFPAYPTGGSLLLYWFSRMSGIHAEWFWAWVQALLIISCAGPLFCFIEGESRAEKLFLAALTAGMGLAVVCGNMPLRDLLVDTLVPMLGLTGALLLLRYGPGPGGWKAALVLLTAFVPMVKNSGWYYAALLVLLVLLECRGRERWKLAAAQAVAMLAMNRFWTWHVRRAFENGLSTQHAMSIESFAKTYEATNEENIREIFELFRVGLPKVGRIGWLLLAVGLLVLLCGDRRDRRRQVLMMLPAWALYVLSLLGMYIFSMGASIPESFRRYYNIFTVFCAGYLWALTLILLPGREIKRRLAAAVLAFVLLVGHCAPNLNYLKKPGRYQLRDRFDLLVEQEHIPEEQSYLMLVNQEHAIVSKVMCLYLLRPVLALPCSDPAELDEAMGRTAYYIVLDEDSPAARELYERLGTESPAGWIP